MRAGAHQYPQPREDLDNRELLRGWREGRLMLQRCRGCDRTIFYPRPLCPRCWSTELAWEQASGRGKAVSFSLVHRPNDPAFYAEVPIILAEIMLEEKVTMIGRVIAPAPALLRCGIELDLLRPEEAVRYALPTFRILEA
jgi:uncharacterized OB-fold protein